LAIIAGAVVIGQLEEVTPAVPVGQG
jgi:hypothetical protein